MLRLRQDLVLVSHYFKIMFSFLYFRSKNCLALSQVSILGVIKVLVSLVPPKTQVSFESRNSTRALFDDERAVNYACLHYSR